MTSENAELSDGRTIRYNSEPLGEGAQKIAYKTDDGLSVILFYKDKKDTIEHDRDLKRLDAIVNKHNPTVLDKNAAYWKQLFCWPTGIVVKPGLGVTTPLYPSEYFFKGGTNTRNKEKTGDWYWGRKASRFIAPEERGDFRGFMRGCIQLSRAVAKMHVAGLAHSDLSVNNVLLDPVSMKAYVIDIDSLVVPQKFPPQVLGTPKYIAPEVLKTEKLSREDPKRVWPSILTDNHALPVLIYQYLLFRHPLDGPKFHCKDPDENESIKLGSGALFVENPRDTSNRDKDIKVPCTVLGEQVSKLFMRAFVDGLHDPPKRPEATLWEDALARTWDMLWPCQNKACTHKWFVITGAAPVRCPFCGTRQTEGGPIPVLSLKKQVRDKWVTERQLVITRDKSHSGLFQWHIYSGVTPGAGVDPTRLAYFRRFDNGTWALTNEKLTTLTSPKGNIVDPGGSVELVEGAQI
jgi:hypothetical protein